MIAFFSTSAVLIASEPLSFNTIYVNNDNVDGPWNGTQEHPFRLIQDAIDFAGPHHIILVANGTYYEHLYIPLNLAYLTIGYWDKPLGELDDFGPRLIGNGTGTGISIHASNVKITLLEITNFGQEGRDAGIYIEYNVEAVQITNNVISDSYHGIWIKRDVPKDTFHIIERNLIKNITQRGISVTLCDKNTLRANTISNCNWGLYIHDCYNNQISENYFNDNTEGLVIDIGMENIVEKNTFIENDYGFGTVGTHASKIQKNNFIKNSKAHAYFITFSVVNADVWSGNYWGRFVFPLVKPIFGNYKLAKIDLPWVKFDFFPSLSQN